MKLTRRVSPVVWSSHYILAPSIAFVHEPLHHVVEVVGCFEELCGWVQVLYTAGPAKVWYSNLNAIIVTVLSSNWVML